MTTNGHADRDLGALVTRLATDLGGVARDEEAGRVEFRRGDRVFAVLHGRRLTLRLRADIAEAALRTPGTAPSARGAEWIDFEPDPSNAQDVDRLRAWLTIGWRSAQRHN